MEESSEVFVELKETLNELLQKLYESTKKKKVQLLNISNKKKQYNKLNVANILTRKKKKCCRVGEKHEKIKTVSQISVK